MKTAIFLALTLILAACNISKFNQHSTNNSKNDKQNSSTPLVISADLNADFSAHWLLNNTIVIEGIKDNASYFLAMLDSKSIQPKIVKKIALKLTTLEQNIIQDAPHLAQYTVLKIDDDSLNIKAWLKEKIAVIAVKNNSLVQLAYIQQSKLLDKIYAKNIDKNEALGATITQNNLSLKLWAPTAKNVALLLFNKEKTPINNSPIQMIEDTNTGIWSTALPLEHFANYYQYQVTLYHPASQKVETLITTDPYSLSLSSNSK